MIERIVSGGQSGVDRAALDVALRLGIPCGGWCPRDRLAEDGPISRAYPLEETPTHEYAERTFWNVRDADGTLVLMAGPASGGTAYTVVCAKQLERPWLALDLLENPSVTAAHGWIRTYKVGTLNVAGPRESSYPGVYALGAAFLETLILELQDACPGE